MIHVLNTNINWLTLFILVLPAAAVLILRFTGNRLKWLGGWLSIATSLLLSLVSGLLLFLYIYRGNLEFIVEFPGPWLHVGGHDIRPAFHYDALSLIFLVGVHFLTFIILASSGVLRSGESPSNGFFASLVLCQFSLTGLLCSSDLFIFYIFWTMAGVACFWLIESESDKRSGNAPGLVYFLQDTGGGLLLLISILSLSAGYSLCDWRQIAALKTEMTEVPLYLRCGIFGGLLAAVFCRANIMPCNLMLSAMDRFTDALKSYLVPVFLVFPGSYLFIRFSLCAPQDLIDGLMLYLPFVALMLVLIASFQSIPAKIISYLAAGEIAFIFSSFCAGLSTSGIIHLFVYSFSLIVILIVVGFMYKGGIQREGNSANAGKPSRLFESAAFIIAGLSLAGFPSTAGFIAKSPIIMQYVQGFDFSAIQIIPLATLGGVIFLFVMNLTRLYFLLFAGGGETIGQTEGTRGIPSGVRILIIFLLLLQIPTLYTFPSYFPFSADAGWLSGLRYDKSLFFHLSGLGGLSPVPSGDMWIYAAGAYAVILCMGAYAGYMLHQKTPAMYREEIKPFWALVWKNELYIPAFWYYSVAGGLKTTGALLDRIEKLFDSIFSMGQYIMNRSGETASGLERLFIVDLHDKVPSFAARINRMVHPFLIFELHIQIIISISLMVMLLFFFLFFML